MGECSLRVLITGGTSKIGQLMLERVQKLERVSEILCITRKHVAAQGKVKYLIANVEEPLDETLFSGEIDLCIHLAALTHSQEPKSYYKTNHEGTLNLIKLLQQKQCKKVIYFSSQTAGLNAGEYAHSKFLAEQALLQRDWQTLVVLRPAEVMGCGGSEGIDKLHAIANRLRVFPVFIDFRTIYFHPIHVNGLIEETLKIIVATFEDNGGVKHIEIRGPKLSSWALFCRFLKRQFCLPIPVPLPLLAETVEIMRSFGIQLFPKDQIARLRGVRGQSPQEGVQMQVIECESGLG